LDRRTLVAGVRGVLGLNGSQAGRIDEYLRRRYAPKAALLTDSGTAALRLAITSSAAGGARPLVGLPAYSCYDVATAAEGAGAEALFYDVDPETLGPDLDSLRDVLAERPSALVIAHLYGVPADVLEVGRMTGGSGTVLIEDAAQGSGGSLGGRALGSFGSLAVLSFGRGKGVTAGSGGALLATDEIGVELLARARTTLGRARIGVTLLGKAGAQWLLSSPSTYGMVAAVPFLHLGETVYRDPTPPRSLSRAASGLLSESVLKATVEEKVRRRHAARLLDHLVSRTDLAKIEIPPEASPGYLRLPVLATTEAARRGLSSRTSIRLGVMPGYPRPLASLSRLRSCMRDDGGALTGARYLAERLFTLPTHSRLGEADLRNLEAWIENDVG
jgi:dTDP-4-amino-4,6-dideoxygalactose transaminase